MRNYDAPESLVILASASDLLLRATDGMLVDGEACTLPQLEVTYRMHTSLFYIPAYTCFIFVSNENTCFILLFLSRSLLKLCFISSLPYMSLIIFQKCLSMPVTLLNFPSGRDI